MWTNKIAEAQEVEDKLPVDPILLEEAVDAMRVEEAYTTEEISKFEKVAKEAILGKQKFTVGQLREVSFDLADRYLLQSEVL